jgi:hypothetical protein
LTEFFLEKIQQNVKTIQHFAKAEVLTAYVKISIKTNCLEIYFLPNFPGKLYFSTAVLSYFAELSAGCQQYAAVPAASLPVLIRRQN